MIYSLGKEIKQSVYQDFWITSENRSHIIDSKFTSMLMKFYLAKLGQSNLDGRELIWNDQGSGDPNKTARSRRCELRWI